MSTITAAPTPALDPAPGALGTSPAASRLGRYTEHDTGAVREIARLSIADGSALVVDRLSGTHGDARLLARLAADEPRENAQILCALYLADESKGRCRPVHRRRPRCRADTRSDSTSAASTSCATRRDRLSHPRVRVGWAFPRAPLDTQHPGPNRSETVRLREVVARFEDYEPARSITANALAAHRSDGTLSTSASQRS